MADLFAKGEKPEFLFWVGCAGAFDDRYKKVARAFAKFIAGIVAKELILNTTLYAAAASVPKRLTSQNMAIMLIATKAC